MSVSIVDRYIAKELSVAEVKSMLETNPGLTNEKGCHGFTLLHIMASGRHKDIVELLIATGADVNTRDKGGQTPLGKD